MLTPSARNRSSWSVGLAFILGTVVFLLVFTVLRRIAPPHEPLIPPHQRSAGALELPELPPTAEAPAKTWRLADHAGRVVLVNYFATWCPPCNAELPDLISLARQFAPRGVDFVAVSLDTPEDRSPPQGVELLLRQFASKHVLPFPILLPSPSTTFSLDSTAIPQTFLYDRQGRRARHILGAITERDLAQSLEDLLKEP